MKFKIIRFFTLFCIMHLAGCQTNHFGIIQRQLINEEIAEIAIQQSNSKYLTEFNISFAKLAATNHITHNNAAKYQLILNIDFSTENLLISQNTDLIQEGLRARVTYELKQQQTTIAPTNEFANDSAAYVFLNKQSFTVHSAHNVTDLPYATYVESEQMKTNLASQAAEEVYKRLFIYFHHKLTQPIKVDTVQ